MSFAKTVTMTPTSLESANLAGSTGRASCRLPSIRPRGTASGVAAFVCAVVLAGCAFSVGPAIPDRLTAADPPAKLRANAEADDGCAFAGTWRYEDEIADGRIDGIFVVQVVDGEIQAMHRFSGRERLFTPRVATCPYESCELCTAGFSCSRGYYILAYVEPNGRTALGASLNPGIGVGRVQFVLSDNGQGLEVSFQTPARYLTAHAAKIKGGACETPVPYVRKAARWATRSYPLSLLKRDALGYN